MTSGWAMWRSALDTLLHFRRKRREDRQRTLREVLQSKTLQRLILFLVILDLLVVALSVQFPWVAVLSTLNAAVDLSLLGIFVFEAAALMHVLSPREYIRKPWHVIDGLFIIMSIVLELHELLVHEDDLHPASPFVSLSIRVWRILRIVHAFTIALELEYQEVQSAAALEGRLHDTLLRVSALESELYVTSQQQQQFPAFRFIHNRKSEIGNHSAVLQCWKKKGVLEEEHDGFGIISAVVRARSFVRSFDRWSRYHEKHARAALERELARLNRVKRSYDALGVRVPF